ncbi:hypothetical protein [Phyllobacterium brassicacearum]|nr:hypothetical protein [Phyllobacterium brassicacearum]
MRRLDHDRQGRAFRAALNLAADRRLEQAFRLAKAIGFDKI